MDEHALRNLCRSIDWSDADHAAPVTQAALNDIAASLDFMRYLVRQPLTDDTLLGLCERFDFVDKLVLFADDVSGVRLRLHIFGQGYFDRPHNHRWSYTARILAGSYTHRLFGTDTELLSTAVDPRTLRPLLVRTETVCSSYTLHYSMVHSVTAAPNTVSLILRGPAERDAFSILDRVTGERWTQYGAKLETAETKRSRALLRNEVEECIVHLERLHLA
jgi:hypothetical protein